MAKKSVKGAESAPEAPATAAPADQPATPAEVSKDTVAVAQVTIEDKSNGREEAEVLHDEQKHWTLATQSFPADQPPATISVRMGLTKNLGDYESARLDIEVTVPCRVEEVPAMQERAKDWLTRVLKKEIRELDERLIYSRSR